MHLQRCVDDYNLFISDHAASQALVMPEDFNSRRKKEQIKGGMFRQVGVKNAFQLFFFNSRRILLGMKIKQSSEISLII